MEHTFDLDALKKAVNAGYPPFYAEFQGDQATKLTVMDGRDMVPLFLVYADGDVSVWPTSFDSDTARPWFALVDIIRKHVYPESNPEV